MLTHPPPTAHSAHPFSLLRSPLPIHTYLPDPTISSFPAPHLLSPSLPLPALFGSSLPPHPSTSLDNALYYPSPYVRHMAPAPQLSLAFRHLASILSSQVSPSPTVGLCFLLIKSSCGSDLLLRNSKVLIAAGQGGLVFTQQREGPHALTVLVVSCFAFHSVWSCLSLFCRVPRVCLSS